MISIDTAMSSLFNIVCKPKLLIEAHNQMETVQKLVIIDKPLQSLRRLFLQALKNGSSFHTSTFSSKIEKRDSHWSMGSISRASERSTEGMEAVQRPCFPSSMLHVTISLISSSLFVRSPRRYSRNAWSRADRRVSSNGSTPSLEIKPHLQYAATFSK